MFRKLALVGFVVVLTLMSSPVQAQGAGTQEYLPALAASYWNNKALSGTPVFGEAVEHVGGDWGYGSPHLSVNGDQFSARWSRLIELEEGDYHFSVTSDDGVSLYVDGRLTFDQWHDHPARTYTAGVAQDAGLRRIVVEYYENTGVAKVALSWEHQSFPGLWQGEYYANAGLSGTPVVRRANGDPSGRPDLEFDWGYDSPADVIPADGFSARWTRLVHLNKGRYRFTAVCDDGVRVYVDQRLLIDEWRDQPTQTLARDIQLETGEHLIVVEYYESTGVAVAKLSWAEVTAPTDSWHAEYYDNRWLSGTPAIVREDSSLFWRWGYGSPASGMPEDGFSVRWTRTVHFDPGLYCFTAITDDGARLWVDGQLLIDAWWEQPESVSGKSVQGPLG